MALEPLTAGIELATIGAIQLARASGMTLKTVAEQCGVSISVAWSHTRGLRTFEKIKGVA